MTAFAHLAAAFHSVWLRFAGRDAGTDALACMGPELPKEAGMSAARPAWR